MRLPYSHTFVNQLNNPLETIIMKLTLLSKTIGTLGLIAALSAVVGTGVQRVAQAQLQPSAQPNAEETAQLKREFLAQQNQERVDRSWVRAVPDFCTAISEEYIESGDPSGLPPLFFDDEGNVRSWDFAGLESALTPEILAVYDQAEKRLSERSESLGLELKMGVIPKASIDVNPKEGFSVTDAIVIELSAAVDAANQDEIPNEEQLDALVEKYGQYANFSRSKEPLYTPAQILEMQSIEREFAATMAAAFTDPEQREYYLRNVDAREAMKSCYPQALLTE
ncbi:MAG: hypothetical protein DCF25_13230 [Leptolyngbya foveolarum]|uniref:Uncharacterized protein n=1 Tax=Leptolyngbya foveolarum TaxID=47253 RepID=A0A2W4U4M0_9CYAN|nr:MAG: hypothetical protein DCF25_13230 [Leptolyngbya foveolarum]